MNRNWMVAAGVAAILALVIGVVVGRSIIPSSAAPEAPEPVTFADSGAGVSLTYPGTWRRLPSEDPQVKLLAAAGPFTSLLLRVTPTEIEDVTQETLPVVRDFTDSLIAENQSAKLLTPPDAVSLGGMVGYRYRYTYSAQDGSAGAHIHYFMFNAGEVIQMVFQAVPAAKLSSAEPTFEKIAATLRRSG